ncbi:MAG: motility-associated protein [Pseudomonadota bacterium]
MTQLLGFILILGLVIAGLAATGAQAVLSALPFELMFIGGTALATLLIANDKATAWAAISGLGRAVRGPQWTKTDYQDLLGVLHELSRRLRRGGHVAIETDVETPEDSPLIQSAPKLAADTDALAVLSSALRLMAIDLSNSQRAREQMARGIQQILDRRMRAASALHTLADALPALGIVAAVLGIVKTMTAIDESTAVIGVMIASALLGTFLGVFLAYGLVGPLAARLSQIIEEDGAALDVIEVFLNAHSDGALPGVCAELALSAIPPHLAPEPDQIGQAQEQRRFQSAVSEAA